MAKLISLLSAGLLLFFCSCKKNVKAETITIRDTVYVAVHDTTVIPGMISDTTTTFIIVRHAEKEATGTDPNLTSAGVARAEELKRILANVPVSAVYSTPLNRTRQTGQPLATAKGVSITEYATSKPYAELVDELLAAWHGKVVLVVGHSNTVPDILKEISNNTFNITINDSQYDNLFIVSMPDHLTPVIQHLKYGTATP
ncbi:MAG TPA: phosphoglycerate mutase family protein [Flavipsychrobacter sp.]|nr:phosphoglycerate mutase family protein [Flavipsychrobacter sp.]